MSRIGKAADRQSRTGVTVTHQDGNTVTVKGPKGELAAHGARPTMQLSQEEGRSR